jgi:hypothetical protein
MARNFPPRGRPKLYLWRGTIIRLTQHAGKGNRARRDSTRSAAPVIRQPGTPRGTDVERLGEITFGCLLRDEASETGETWIAPGCRLNQVSQRAGIRRRKRNEDHAVPRPRALRQDQIRQAVGSVVRQHHVEKPLKFFDCEPKGRHDCHPWLGAIAGLSRGIASTVLSRRPPWEVEAPVRPTHGEDLGSRQPTDRSNTKEGAIHPLPPL